MGVEGWVRRWVLHVGFSGGARDGKVLAGKFSARMRRCGGVLPELEISADSVKYDKGRKIIFSEF